MAQATRQSFGDEIVTLGNENPDIVVVDADLSKSTMTGTFAKTFPDRYFDIGIAESNLVGIGAGLALSGKIPFICSFACFITGRFEQIRMSVAYTQANVKIIGTHVGIGIGQDGYSQMALEDIALIRALPNIQIFQPADDMEAKQVIRYVAQYDGPVYVRLTRQKLEDIHDDSYVFQAGKGGIIKEGSDIALIGSGGVMDNTIKAAEVLQEKGIQARVVNMSSLKPVDTDLIADCARTIGRIVTVEDHSIHGGLGSIVSEVIAESAPARLKRIAVEDFGESGDPAALYDKYGLGIDNIVNIAAHVMTES